MPKVACVALRVTASLVGTCLLLTLGARSAPVWANGFEPQGPIATTEQVINDTAARYAADVGVSLEEAKARLDLQDDIGSLEATLTEKHSSIYAGLWVEHQPDFRIHVLFTDMEQGSLLLEGINPNLMKWIEVQQAQRTVVELERIRAQAADAARVLGIAADSELSRADNTAQLLVLDQAKAIERLSQSHSLSMDHVRVVEVVTLQQGVADIYGGLAGTLCTSGFSVVKPTTGERGVTFAAHCQDYQVVNGVGLSWMSGTSGLPADVPDIQWNLVPSPHTVRNWVWFGNYAQAIYFVKFRASQYEGEYVCRYGKNSGAGCGFIQSKDVSGVNIRVNLASVGGDSGGPWFNNNVAYGTTRSITEMSPGVIHTIYGPVDHIYNVLGLTILTN